MGCWGRLPVYSLLLYTWLAATCVQAQYLQKPVRKITTRDGLPQSFISGLVQDKDGFVWIGTRNGLVRYDGIHFKLFQHSSRDSTTISSNLIISMARDARNRIWIEHESTAIDCLDPVTETVDRVTVRPLFRSHSIPLLRWGWLADARGDLWCVQKANGVFRYDWKGNRVTHFSRRTCGLPSDTVKGLVQDKRQQLWIATQRGLSYRNTETGRFEHVLFPFTADFTNYEEARAEIVAVHERKNGELMLGDRQRLIFYNPATKTFRTVPLPVLPKTGIRWIQEGPDGNEYLESEGIVYRYNDLLGLVAVGDIGLASFRDAQSFLIDRSGLIWLGSNAAGIHQIDLGAPFFESHPTLYSFHYDLLRKEFGLALDELSGWPLADKEFNAVSYSSRSTYDAGQRLWVGLRDRIAFYDAPRKKWVPLPPVPGIGSTAVLSRGIRGMSFGPNGVLWVVGDRGFVGRFDTVQQKWLPFLDAPQLQKGNSELTLLDAVADANKLWITSGSGEGLICIDIFTRQILELNRKSQPHQLPTEFLLGLKPDPANRDLLWIGSYEGLVCLNKKTLKSEIFTVAQGLPDNTIYAIQTDKEGYLWLSTNKGLCRFHPVTHQVRVFRSEDGLPGDEFNRFQSFRLPDGRLAFGGTDGWTLFDPARIKVDDYQPPVVFTSLKINNVPASHAVDGGLPAPLNSLIRLSLPYDQNTLAFDFAALEFNQPQKLLYRYQLKAYDEDWIVTATPVATYTKLPPGHYVLKVNATNTTGRWSSQTRSLLLVIKPPFWLTWWAWALYALVLAGLLWGYIHYRLNRERLQQEVRSKEREALQLKEVDELKTRFFSNITHEFRTPLTLILTPAQRLKPTLERPDQHRWLSAIERNAFQLLRLINQLLDLSKLESGTLRVNETRGDINLFIEEMVRSFREEAEINGVRLRFTGGAQDHYWFDADKLEQIVRNLVANALKFTPQGGEIEIAVESVRDSEGKPGGQALKGGVVVTVSDLGTGIPPDQLPYIFDRFYQAGDSDGGTAVGAKGTGIGLALVKELVDLQEGTIEVASPGRDAAGWHTTFRVWLPYRPAAATDPLPAGRPDAIPVAGTVTAFKPDAAASRRAGREAGDEEKLPAAILLVEDNAELAEFIADSLPEAYSISRAANGAEALEMAFGSVPDLVISDVLMPVMDGFECCRRLKEDERTNHIPVILLTAKASFDSRIEGLTQGADDYLTKPFHIQELQLRVTNLLQRQQRIREKLQQQLSRPDAAASPPLAMAETGPEDVFIKKLYGIIEEKLDDTSFGVQELAGNIGMSRTSLHNKLKALTGMPAGDIIRNYRLNRAARFLKEGNNSSETAYRSGFDSPAYFSKCFREFYGITPLEFAQKEK